MRVLVTGASGGLGQLVVTDLLNLGFEVIATSKNIEKAKELSFYDKVDYISYDFYTNNGNSNLYELFKKPDMLIHLAWDKLNDYQNELHETLILESQKQFLDNLISNGLINVNVIGSCYEYGLQEGELIETMDSIPTLSYTIAKNKLRLYLEEKKQINSFNLTWIRVFYVFGDILGRKNLYTLINQAIKNNDESFDMSGGEQVRDFLTPKEISKLIVQISIQNEITGIVNCCSGKPIKLKDYVQEYLNLCQSKIKLNLGVFPYTTYEPITCWGNTDKLHKIVLKQ